MRTLPSIDPAELTIALVVDDEPRARRLAVMLEEAGYPRLLRLPSALFWCRLPVGRPVQVVAGLSTETLAASLDGFDGLTPCPLSLIGPPPSPEVLARMLDQGLAGWWPEPTLGPAPMAAALVSDAWQWRLRQDAARNARRRDADSAERRWTEHAVELIRLRRGAAPIDRDEACRWLRRAALQRGQRPAELAHGLVEAARWAEAVNRAGQLRMLSQRLVRLEAQEAASGCARPWPAARLQARRRVAENLAVLRRLAQDLRTGEVRGLPGRRLALTALQADWRLLESFICGPLSKDRDLLEFDGAAERFLATAESAVAGIQLAAGRPGLGLVDRCGRQRMAVQRIAKDGVLGVVLGQPHRLSALPVAMAAVDAEFVMLSGAAPLSEAVRVQLGAVRARWSSLRREHRRPDAHSVATLVSGADELLARLETLTDACEAGALDLLR